MKQWVIDKNVIVSGLMTPSGSAAQIIDAVLNGQVKIVYDSRILKEYRDVLSRPRLKLPPMKIQALLVGMHRQLLVSPSVSGIIGPDSDDIIFIEAALATTDKTIITGNLMHFPKRILQGVRILTPVQALAELSH
jgi:uncharacterized protein